MSLPSLIPWKKVHERLQKIFPEGTPNREHCVWEIAAKTIFVMLYVGAVDGAENWIRPDQVTRMTNRQAKAATEAERLAWTKSSTSQGTAQISGRWYAVNTRESIRDDTIRFGLIQNGAVVERSGLTTTSPAPRYALQADFAGLMATDLDEAGFAVKAETWRKQNLTAGALARIALLRAGDVRDSKTGVLVTFPSGETRRMVAGESAEISKAVIEIFTAKFLKQPGVIFLSESGNKVVERDDERAKKIGLTIPAAKNLPDIVLVDVGPEHPLLIFVEVVSTDGPINEARKHSLLQIFGATGFPRENVAFVTAFLDRSSVPFRKTVSNLAWGSYAWFVSEPDKLVIFTGKATELKGGEI